MCNDSNVLRGIIQTRIHQSFGAVKCIAQNGSACPTNSFSLRYIYLHCRASMLKVLSVQLQICQSRVSSIGVSSQNDNKYCHKSLTTRKKLYCNTQDRLLWSMDTNRQIAAGPDTDLLY